MIHVAVAVIENDKGEVLISKRHDHLHQGGLWEYPGGKVEAGEDVQKALAREIDEELGLKIASARPLIRIPHDYGDRQVLLDVWRVTNWSGEPQGREGQALQWVSWSRLSEYAFPEANRPITHAVQLPSIYVISPEPADIDEFMAQVEAVLSRGCTLLQLRAKAMPDDRLERLAREVKARCDQYQAGLLVNGNIQLAEKVGCGVHLTSSLLHTLNERPLSESQWVAASCHMAEDIVKATKLNCDFIVLSPVEKTASHPESQPLGWGRFAECCEHAAMPVFALGGLSQQHIEQVQSCGGQGVAGISGFWPR